jgi:hypothetical protein
VTTVQMVRTKTPADNSSMRTVEKTVFEWTSLVATLFSVPKKLPRKLSVATVFLDFLSNSALSRVLANK